MSRQQFLDLASKGHRTPIGTHLLLHEKEHPEGILRNGVELGRLLEEAAHRYQTPLAFPIMDLTIEKESLLGMLGVPIADIPKFHFSTLPGDGALKAIQSAGASPPERGQAVLDAIRYLATRGDLIPMGMAIGPFSLMTKLLADPIPPIFMAGRGINSDDEEEVAVLEQTLQISCATVLWYLRLQIEAGASAICVCEPAASRSFLSPNQLTGDSDIFARYVMSPNRKIKELLDSKGVDLFFHCCGELTEDMVRRFGTLHPAVLSLGGSRELWKDQAIVPEDVTLYGNLPSKKFYSDSEISLAEVSEKSQQLSEKMRETGHPFILGTECDVLSVPGSEETLKRKVMTLVGKD